MKFILRDSKTEHSIYNKDTDIIDVASKLTLIFLLIYIADTGIQFPILSFICVGAILFIFVNNGNDSKSVKLMWGLICILLLFDIIEEWTRPANHHFILLYFCLAFFFSSFKNFDYKTIFQWNIRMIIGLLLLFAGTQKILSAQYTDGTFLNFMFITGDLASHSIFPKIETNETVIANLNLLDEFNAAVPNENKKISLSQVYWFSPLLYKSIAYISIGFEIVAGICILIFPNRLFSHLAFILVIVGVFILRLECGFLSLLCIGGYVLTTSSQTLIKRIYISLLLIFLTLMIIRFGYT